VRAGAVFLSRRDGFTLVVSIVIGRAGSLSEGKEQVVDQEVPPAQRHIIKRPRLYRLLDEANARIVLLCAPAGYGKTTLARQWTALRGRQAFWYRANAAAADPVALALGVVGSLAEVYPIAQRRLTEYLLGTAAPDEAPDVLAEIIAENAEPWPRNGWLVIDDYHAFGGAVASERVVERLCELSNLRVVITSRTQPRWISARRVLYGEAFELGRDDLAMDENEALSVLALGHSEPSRVVELANGWPAVIGLATLAPGAEPNSSVPLHDFLAEELFSSLQPRTQEALPLIALSPRYDPVALDIILGPDAASVVADAERVGLVSRTRGVVEIHPLVRSFLEAKANATIPPGELLERLTAHFIRFGDWDDAFELIETYRLDAQLIELLRNALPGVLSAGRAATVERWTAYARTRTFDQPEITLAHAELLLRRGHWTAAETMACACAPLLRGTPLAAYACLCAGTAAHLADRARDARGHFARALQLDESPNTLRRALWGEFLCAKFDGRTPDIGRSALARLAAVPDASPAHLVRLSQARLIEAAYGGGFADTVDAELATEALLSEVADPLITTGFLNNLSDALVMTCRYAEGERLARVELELAKRNRLDFVVPNALTNIASSRAGLGDFIGADALLDEISSMDSQDSFVTANVIGIRTRLRSVVGSVDHTLTADEIPSNSRADIRGEALASLALASAISGQVSRAIDFASAAENEARSLGFALGATKVLLAATTAIIEATTPTAEVAVARLMETVQAAGVYDGIMWAIRGSQPLLDACLSSADATALLKRIAQRSGDASLRAALGLPSLPIPHGTVLSPREIEILELVAQGLRNVDVSARLYISPKTVKTHLQNIFEKLDVRSRTAAVVKAKNAGLLS